MPFQGFPPEALKFLRGIERNNDREWFQAHRDDYEGHLLEPARDLVVDLGARLRRLSKDVHAEPQVDRSIRRMNRDIRFSKDKRPYKNHLDLWFWQGSGSGPGYWFRLTPTQLMLGAGMHGFDRPVLERYREAVADPKRGAALERAIARARKAGSYEVGGQAYKRVPAGFDPGHPRAELLKHGALYAGLNMPVPREIHTAAFVDFCFRRYRPMAPLQDWLAALVRD